MDNYAGVTRWTCDCKVMRCLSDGNAWGSHVLWLMSTDSLDSEFADLVCDLNGWESFVLYLMLTDGVELCEFASAEPITGTLRICMLCTWC